jgi:integration host factor subunit alpha
MLALQALNDHFTSTNGRIQMTLTKADIVQEVYKNHNNLTRTEANTAVEAFLKLSKGTLIKGSDLLLSGFGKFNVRDKNPRRGRNPQTGEDLTLDARRVVTFKPSGILRNRVNAE